LPKPITLVTANLTLTSYVLPSLSMQLVILQIQKEKYLLFCFSYMAKNRGQNQFKSGNMQSFRSDSVSYNVVLSLLKAVKPVSSN
jgi:hypothetical protein